MVTPVVNITGLKKDNALKSFRLPFIFRVTYIEVTIFFSIDHVDRLVSNIIVRKNISVAYSVDLPCLLRCGGLDLQEQINFMITYRTIDLYKNVVSGKEIKAILLQAQVNSFPF